MKSSAVVAVAAFMVIGCAVLQTTEPIKELNPRIVYRDLTKTKPIFFSVPKDAFQEGRQDAGTNSTALAGKSEAIVYYIEFANDSHTNFDNVQLGPLVAATPSTAHVLVVGHSHGKSAVGTMSLASKRAESIRDHLKGAGFVNVHTMAFWGAEAVSFAPTRGVQVYVLPAGAEQGKTLPVVFAKQARGVIYEDRKEDSVVSCGVVGDHPAKAGLGNV